MNDYMIFTEVTTDLSSELLEQIDVTCINMTLMVEDTPVEHYADFRNLSYKDFYNNLRKQVKVTTTQINCETYTEYFENALKEGKDVIYLAFSSGLSGTIQSAKIAIDALQEKYPERKIYCVDTLCASCGGGMFVYYAAMKKKEGLNIDELYNWCENSKLHLSHWFTVEDLFFLHRGGRVSKTVAIAGSLLKIMPVMHVDNDGHLIVVNKERGRHKALEALANQMFKTAISLEKQTIFIGHGDDIEAAEYLANYINKNNKPQNIIILPIGPIIGSHSGPGTIALFFWANER